MDSKEATDDGVAKTRKSPSQLKMREVIKLVDWLRLRSQNADWSNQNAVSLSAEATAELKFEVTRWNVKTTAKSIGLRLPTRRLDASTAPKNQTRAHLARLHRAVVELYAALGHPVPTYLVQKELTHDSK